VDVDRVVFRWIPDAERRVEMLLRGDVDLITALAPALGRRVAADPGTSVQGVLYAGLYVLMVNVWVPPLNHPLVRQALSLAIDRESIVKELWHGRGLVPSGPIPRGDNHHDAALPPPPYDPGAARERLRRAGYRGETVHFETTTGMIANDRAMAEAITEMWEDVGVRVALDVIDTEARHLKNRQRTFKGLWWSDPTSVIRDPEGMMGRLLAPERPRRGLPADDRDLPRAEPVDRGVAAGGGLRPAPLRGVHAQPRSAGRASAVQLPAAPPLKPVLRAVSRRSRCSPHPRSRAPPRRSAAGGPARVQHC
jgi:ABC-type transport system substrate-binding protein